MFVLHGTAGWLSPREPAMLARAVGLSAGAQCMLTGVTAASRPSLATTA